ncbi:MULTISPECIES: cytochrome c peroxidase [unclassified Pseudoalteromonas]|uniref:cytochrome-c peroxidase n=1 Tax=unclassified Pseudoalteromonas TaxID=194690 RepID=UPI00209680FC|nr:cytochrome c peroxidase [Pseudoalteromonas sp. XMcav2-N]MCO7191034.1 c-type cytochrome [Pseudoalteromonas sp. XMcav2-N]
MLRSLIWVLAIGSACVVAEPILPLQSVATDARKVALGRQLFFDTRLSRTNDISCASCHQLSSHGADNSARSKGAFGRLGEVRAPTVYNSVFNIRQAWDGKAIDLKAQVTLPVENPKEFATTWPELIATLNQDQAFRAAFTQVYRAGLSSDSISDAIAHYERSLITLNAPFDLWLQGKATLSEQAQEGYRLFKYYGCINCHQGKNVGGNMFAKMGTFGDYFGDRGTAIEPSDYGRYNVTGREEDKFTFKVPGLRMAARQTYFFHDGSEQSLTGAINTMARYQLGRSLSEAELAAIAAFLESLVGHHQEMDQ